MYLDYIPEDSLETNDGGGEFLDFVPEPKPEFVEVKEVVKEVKKKPVKKVTKKKAKK